MISTTTNRDSYTGDNTTNVYDYTFKIFDQSHIKVVLRRISTLVETVLTITTDYTVQDVGEDAGGTITLVDSNQAWLDGSGYLDADYKLVMYRSIPYKQENDFANQGDFAPEDHERAFDELVMQVQRLAEEVQRCVKVSAADYTAELVLPAKDDRANMTMAFDADGLPTVE
jgi:hypothetical protein